MTLTPVSRGSFLKRMLVNIIWKIKGTRELSHQMLKISTFQKRKRIEQLLKVKNVEYHYCKLTWASLLLEYPTRLEYLRLPETTFMSSGSTKPTQCIYKSESHNPIILHEKIITKDNIWTVSVFIQTTMPQNSTEMSTAVVQVAGHGRLKFSTQDSADIISMLSIRSSLICMLFIYVFCNHLTIP